MRYIGSKISTIQQVYELISSRVSSGVLCDPFGGTGVVGSYFKNKGYSVRCGDILTFAHYFQVARVQVSTVPRFATVRNMLGLASTRAVIDTLNSQPPIDGWLVAEYAEKRRFFTLANARQIEACRRLIGAWWNQGWLDPEEQAVLLASLIESADRVANTAGTYYAYLKAWHRKALLPFRFELVAHTPGPSDCRSFLSQAADLVRLQRFDILYLDPPYNDRCYSGYYHLPETLARGETPSVHGKGGLPDEGRPKSSFNKQVQAGGALAEIVDSARFRLLAFHYSDDGLIPPDEVNRLLGAHGHVQRFSIQAKGYTTERSRRTVEHSLYLVQHG